MAALLTIAETARATHLSKTSVRRKITAGELAAVKLGPRSVRVWADSVDVLLTRGWQPASTGREAA
jgi:excisionase family DNA binding protein